jgi:hypothetical protein
MILEVCERSFMSDSTKDFPYMSDGDDEERQGVGDLPLREDYEISALRDEVARQFEALLDAVEAWREDDDTGEADEIYQELSDIYDRVGEPVEDTDAQ